MTTPTARRDGAVASPGTAEPGTAGPATSPARRVLVAQVGAEVRQNLRVPDFVIGVVAVPAILYAMFALPNAGNRLPAGTDVAAVMLASFACYGVVSLAIFSFGVDVAQERGKGWLRRLQATPMPTWAYFAGKAAMAVVFSALVVAGVLAVALLGGVALEPGRLAGAVAVLLLGGLAFSTMGLALAFWVRPRAATALGNLLFLPLSFASGFLFPLDALPGFLADAAPALPTYHFGQFVWSQIAPAEDLLAYGAPATGALGLHAAVVVASFLAFGVLAAAGYRRDARR